MYDKAKSFLVKGLLALLSLIIFALCLAASLSPIVSAHNYTLFHFSSLILSFLLLINLILLIIWIFKKNIWVIIPIMAFIANYNYIFSIVQIDPFSRKKPEINSFTFNIASYNVHGFNFKENEEVVNRVAEEISNRDISIFCMQEYMSNEMFNENEIEKIFEFLPHKAIRSNSLKQIGLAIFSKYPIIQSCIVNFRSSANGAVWADIRLPYGKVVRVINVHFQTTGINGSHSKNYFRKYAKLRRNFKIRAEQSEIIYSLIKESKYPVILCGDFNAMPSSYIYRKAKGNLIDGFRQAGFGFGSTFEKKISPARIDYIFHDKDFKCLKYQTEWIDLSDHMPVISTLSYKIKR